MTVLPLLVMCVIKFTVKSATDQVSSVEEEQIHMKTGLIFANILSVTVLISVHQIFMKHSAWLRHSDK